ncbi:MAG: DUF5110 domain-containing protein, partial [Bacteroidota bacterium]
MANPMQSTVEYNPNVLRLHYYHDESVAESERTLYNDDGETKQAFEKGIYELLKFKSEFTKNALKIELEAATGAKYATSTKEIEIIIHNINTLPKKVKFRGKRVNFKWNTRSKILQFNITWNTKKERKITIKL